LQSPLTEPGPAVADGAGVEVGVGFVGLSGSAVTVGSGTGVVGAGGAVPVADALTPGDTGPADVASGVLPHPLRATPSTTTAAVDVIHRRDLLPRTPQLTCIPTPRALVCGP
jgi:hypothetical protein